MPEYSSTTITPADGVQVPSMNGSTSGNFALSALRDYILASKGQANGLASLGSDGKLTPSQLPDLADDVIVVASYAVLPATGTAGKIYITADNNKMYRWDSDEADYVELSVDLSEYAKLTDLAAEESARETADTNLNDACSALDKRVTNLELKTGDQFEVDYPSDTYGMNGVPSDVEPYAEVGILKGVGRIANQLVDTTKQSGYNATQNVSGTAFDITTLVLAGYGGFRGINIVTGHVYLFGVECKTKASSSIRVGWFNSQGQGVVPSFIYLSQGFNTQLFTSSVSGTDNQFLFYGEVGKTDYYDNFIIRDLTVYFNGNIPTNAQTLAQIQTNYPELLEPSDYGTEVVFPTYTGLRAEGVNIFDEETESGYYNSTGNAEPSSSNIRSKNYIEVKGNTTYYTNQTVYVCQYDESKNFIGVREGVSGGATFTTLSDARYIRFNWPSTYGTTYLHDTQIALNSSAEKATYHAYHAPNTLTLPAPVTLKGAGSVSEEYYPETGRVTHPIGEYTITGSESFNPTGGNQYIITGWGQAQGAKLVAADRVVNLLCSFAIPDSYNNANVNGQVGKIALDDRGYLLVTSDIRNNWSNLVGEKIYYELATPSADTYVDPLPDNFVKVEPNGTIKPIQSQSPEVDSAMTVEYMAS